MSLEDDALRWASKVELATDNSDLVERVKNFQHIVKTAQTAFEQEDYEKAVNQIERAQRTAERAIDTSGWPNDSLDYLEKFESESVPALDELKQKYQS